MTTTLLEEIMAKHIHVRRALSATVAIVVGLSLGSAPAFGQFAVIDNANLAQTILTAKRTLDEINNQILQIQQFLQMLQNEERNLTSLPFSVIQSLDQSIALINGLMQQAQGIVYNVQNVQAQFQRFYPSNVGVGAPISSYTSDAQTRWQYSLQAFQQTMEVQSQIVQEISVDQAQMDGLVAQSQGAVGALQATQAGNQLIALHAKQLAALQALLAAQARAQATEMARKAETEGQAYAQFQQFLGAAPGDYAAVPVTMFH
jgi:P-type conjugative transfer protein TrbJ